MHQRTKEIEMSAYDSVQLFWLFLVVCVVCGSVRSMWSYLIRHLNIRKAGWPPAHLDADGDWKQEQESE